MSTSFSNRKVSKQPFNIPVQPPPGWLPWRYKQTALARSSSRSRTQSHALGLPISVCVSKSDFKKSTDCQLLWLTLMEVSVLRCLRCAHNNFNKLINLAQISVHHCDTGEVAPLKMLTLGGNVVAWSLITLKQKQRRALTLMSAQQIGEESILAKRHKASAVKPRQFAFFNERPWSRRKDFSLSVASQRDWHNLFVLCKANQERLCSMRHSTRSVIIHSLHNRTDK